MGIFLFVLLWMGGIFVSDKIEEKVKANREKRSQKKRRASMRVIKGCRQTQHLKKSA